MSDRFKFFQKGKSPRHLAIQNRIQQLLLPHTCQLEVRLPEIKRIADVLWTDERCVFEVQCSPITSEEVFARVKDYRSLGYKIVWIFSAEAFFKHPLRLQKAIERVPHYFTDITFRGIGDIFDHHQGVCETFPVDLAKPFCPKDFARYETPPHLQKRVAFWEIGFSGDLLDRCPKNRSLKKGAIPKLFHRYEKWLDRCLYKLWQ